MKIAFSREVKYIPDWNGNKSLPENEQCTAILIPLQMSDLVGLVEVIQEFEGGEDGEVKVPMEKAVGVLGKINHLKDNITINNLEDESGPVTSDDIVKFPRFMGLTMELYNQLAAISMPNEDDEKNSNAQPA